MKEWDPLSEEDVCDQIDQALKDNISYGEPLPGKPVILGLPGSRLEPKIFEPEGFPVTTSETKEKYGYDKKQFSEWQLLNCFLNVLYQNPNHIGVHSSGGDAEPAFRGTQALEREMLKICAEFILDAEPDSWSGYATSGGTESNIFALYRLREKFIKEDPTLTANQVVVCCSVDTHYSVAKAARILGMRYCAFEVGKSDRQLEEPLRVQSPKVDSPEGIKDLCARIKETWEETNGKTIRRAIVVANMGTTMFGSVDDSGRIELLCSELKGRLGSDDEIPVHVDAAYGGFIYPFTTTEENPNPWQFGNSMVHSITLDPHKMLNSPYNAGIYLARGDFTEDIEHDAPYVPGNDSTLIGSRSGALPLFDWMVLQLYGSKEGTEAMNTLVKTAREFNRLLDKAIRRFQDPNMNHVSVFKDQFSDNEELDILVEKYGLHDDSGVVCVVMMHHTNSMQSHWEALAAELNQLRRS